MSTEQAKPQVGPESERMSAEAMALHLAAELGWPLLSVRCSVAVGPLLADADGWFAHVIAADARNWRVCLGTFMASPADEIVPRELMIRPDGGATRLEALLARTCLLEGLRHLGFEPGDLDEAIYATALPQIAHHMALKGI